MEPRDAINDDPKESSRTFGTRVVEAILPLLGALFLGAITVGVVGARVSGPPIFGILLRVFFALVVGGIALWLAIVAVQALAGVRRRTAGKTLQAPVSISDLCPACGRPAQRAQWCPVCELPLGEAVSSWRPEDRSPWVNLVLLCLGAGLVCLGVFVTVGPLLEGEGRGWAMVAFAALGLLIAGVGALMLWGGAIFALEDLRGLARWSYGLDLTRPEARYSVSSTATFARTRLLHVQGQASMDLALGARQSLRPATGLSPAQQGFARALSLLYDRGQVALWWSRTTSWTIGTPGKVRLLGRFPPISTETATTMKLQLISRRVPGPADDESRALLVALAPLQDGPTPVSTLWRSCRDSGLDALPSPAVAPTPDGRLAEQAVAAEISDEHLN